MNGSGHWTTVLLKVRDKMKNGYALPFIVSRPVLVYCWAFLNTIAYINQCVNRSGVLTVLKIQKRPFFNTNNCLPVLCSSRMGEKKGAPRRSSVDTASDNGTDEFVSG